VPDVLSLPHGRDTFKADAKAHRRVIYLYYSHPGTHRSQRNPAIIAGYPGSHDGKIPVFRQCLTNFFPSLLQFLYNRSTHHRSLAEILMVQFFIIIPEFGTYSYQTGSYAFFLISIPHTEK
jgi:hypothetical protein